MAAGLQFEVDGVLQLNRDFSRFGEYMQDIRGSFPEMKSAFFKGEKEQFASSMGMGPWAALSPKYAEWKAQNFPGAPILVRTGGLRDLMTGGSPDLEWKEDKQALTVTVNNDIAAYHQRGTSKMPAREVIYLSEMTKKEFTLVLHRWLFGVMKNIGIGGT